MMVATKLNLDWSPEQISGWLKLKFPNDESMQVSHETIYRSLFIQARGVLKKELIEHLRSRRMMRRSKKATTDGQPRGQIVDGISIRERPAEVEDRAIPGHWEGDLERLTKPLDVPPTDEGAGKRKEGLVNVCPLLMADAQSAESMKPSKCSLNDPSPSAEPFA
jgi:hypothetical protein